ncbi:facilitated trehalose transporter Tret1-2 homolog isoform X1 [Drosophila santomea]|uniref:facilitated trehalose transporter Tret1-2 homolog isoform X1 n=1 Tax=Drosophila santomea TaxID=129105 RepID=UPI001954A16F|nr:facilitated trehalose transporter Tret1-2 homolog isoform X1 [Drosophila santomea]
MDSEKVVRAMARWWQTVSQEDGDTRNPITYDLLQESESRTSKTRQYVAAMIICLGAVAAGTALSWTAPVFPQISAENETINQGSLNSSTGVISNSTSSKDDIRLTDSQIIWVSSMLPLGALFGALPSGYIADTIGRRYTAMVMDIPFILAWISISFANSVGWLYLGRFLIGISTGSFCVVAPMYISEIAETSIRGSLGTLFQLLLTIGILFIYVVGALVSWKTLSMLCILIPILLLCGLFIVPETPVYLLKRGKRSEANRALKWLWGDYCNTSNAIQAIQNDLDQTGADASVKDLFSNRASRNGMVISVLLMVFQQFSGINAVIFFMNQIFLSSRTLNPDVCTIVVGVVQVIMTLTSSLLIEKAGRKILLIFSSTIMTVCLAMLGAYNTIQRHTDISEAIGWLPLLCIVLFIVSFSVGYGPIPWMIMGELFMPDVKGIAVSLSVMMNWVCVFLVTWLFGLLNAAGADVPFWFFSAWMAVATAYVAIALQETKGKSANQIQSWLSGR